MDLDDQLMQEQLLSSPMAVDDSRWLLVGRINNDFDVNEFKQDEEEQKEEERIGDVVSSDLEDSNDEQGGRHAMPPSFLSLHMCTMQSSLWRHLGHSLLLSYPWRGLSWVKSIFPSTAESSSASSHSSGLTETTRRMGLPFLPPLPLLEDEPFPLPKPPDIPTTFELGANDVPRHMYI
jgi:hypothetical protein